MKASPLACVLLVLLAVAVQWPFTSAAQTNTRLPDFRQVQSPAQQSTTNAAGSGTNDETASALLEKFRLGIRYQCGFGVERDEAKGWALIREAAKQGCVGAQFYLGYGYGFGEGGLEQDYGEAAKWYRMAAKNGDAESEYELGLIYYKGQLGKPDYKQAAYLITKAAEQGHTEAQCGLGVMYCQGTGVPQDNTEAVKWLQMAAEKSNPEAEWRLGLCYWGGQGVTKDFGEAVNWFLKAAKQGDAKAQSILGLCYYEWNGVPKNSSNAFKWFRKAAEQGDADAQNELAKMYASGDGVPANYVEAYKWVLLAAANGNESAKKVRLPMEREQLTPDQIAEGQRLAAEFKPRKESASNFTPPRPDEIIAAQTEAMASGTGFFITDDGYLISNNHVVKGATKVRLVTGAGLIDAKVVSVDAANDLALLKVEGKFSPLPISPSRSAQLGSTVATVGFPDIGLQGFAPKLAKGEIASLSGASDDPRYFQISVPVQPGNSGGALVDEHGNVIGIVSAKLDASAALAASGALPENVNYAVKSSFLLSFLESVPDVSAKLKAPNTADEKFSDVMKSAQNAAVLVLVY